jgi:electron transport complex protein RnfG
VQATGPTYDKATLLIGVTNDRKITDVKFMAISDTPGYGQKAPGFYEGKFKGKSTDDGFVAKGDVEAVSGATITSNGVAAILKNATYVAGEYLAKQGGLASTGPAPTEAPEAKPFTYEEAFASLFPDDIYPGVTFREDADGLNRVVKNMLVVKQVRAEVNGAPVGYIVATQGQAYYGPAVVVAGVDLQHTVKGTRIIRLEDTPKVGLLALEEKFWRSFDGKKAEEAFLAGQAYDTISGASITADCIADIAKVAAVEAAKLVALSGGQPWTAGDDYPLNEHYLEG